MKTVTYNEFNTVLACRNCNEYSAPTKMDSLPDSVVYGCFCWPTKIAWCERTKTTVGEEAELNWINRHFYVKEGPKCECGAAKCKSNIHSHWCPKRSS